jgi:three-Cys-motif partner protein
VEDYLKFYTQVLKNQSFKLCYIDAFSGSGNVELKDGQVVDGLALRALRYDFDSYYFFEKNEEYYNALSAKIKTSFSDKRDKIEIKNSDCNEFLQGIDQRRWYEENWRGVIFLDPCAMDLEWSSLEKISRTEAFDVWYLFPFSAVTRNLPRSGVIQPANESKLTKVLGSADWMQHIYEESQQQTLFEQPDLIKVPDGLKQYILSRLNDTFPTVAPNPALLRNEKNSSLFLLCFTGSNPGEKAKERALAGANHILKRI